MPLRTAYFTCNPVYSNKRRSKQCPLTEQADQGLHGLVEFYTIATNTLKGRQSRLSFLLFSL